ncbi:MAG: excinuclease ABC subunit UvrA [Desulfurellaceae bacterium]|nr:excinuclease ABC subunit UvrA [Desulfurellaceae bacterium]
METISIRGARQHNLKNISVDIPRNSLVVITGVSGSGKSSLAFDVLYAEGRRRYVESLSAYARQFLDQRAKPEVDSISGLSPAVAIEPRVPTSSPRSTVGTVTELADYVRLLYVRVGTPYCLRCERPLSRHSVPQIVDRVLAFPEGSRLQIMAPVRVSDRAQFDLAVQELRRAGFVRVRVAGQTYELTDPVPLATELDLVVDRLIVKSGIARRLADSIETTLRYGRDVVKIGHTGPDEAYHEDLFTQTLRCPACGFGYPDLTPAFFSPNSPEGACPECDGLGRRATGAKPGREKRSGERCGTCAGTGLTAESRGVRIQDRDIAQLSGLSIAQALEFFRRLSFSGQAGAIAAPVCQAIRTRLQMLNDIGLGYLRLDRPLPTLSGGEAQRVRLSTQLGAGLSGILYVLDEPSIGLHPRDTTRLLAALHQLRDQNNSVVVVEHDPETIRAADYIIDLGPGAGEGGGEVLATGTPHEVQAQAGSITGRYLRGELSIPVPTRRRKTDHSLTIDGVQVHNLQNVTASFPLGVFGCVTGVSGSGKSSLVLHALAPAVSQALAAPADAPPTLSGWQTIGKLVQIDQSPISRTPHSNPASYVGLFTPLRQLFARLPDAQVRGYGPQRFSFNVKGGRCEACLGSGMVGVDMHFLPDVYVECEVCHGLRYNRETLEVRFRGLSIAEVLNLSVAQALEVLTDLPKIRPRLETLRDLGLDYLRLGQPAPSLSGGEAQRLKLARELSRRPAAHTLYLMDEPTTGLHLADIQRLLQVLNLLVEAGHSVLVIEHNLDVIKTADFVLDLGPEGGQQGGQVVAAGTPEEIARVERSHTGRFLRRCLSGL